MTEHYEFTIHTLALIHEDNIMRHILADLLPIM